MEPYPLTSLTRPTCPLTRRTLMPCEWVGELVIISLTTPWVSLPLCWSAFNTMANLHARFDIDANYLVTKVSFHYPKVVVASPGQRPWGQSSSQGRVLLSLIYHPL